MAGRGRHAARSYSWISPPRTFRRRILAAIRSVTRAVGVALAVRRPAYQFLMGKLPDGRQLRYLLAAEIAEAGQPAAQRVHAWTRVLEVPATMLSPLLRPAVIWKLPGRRVYG
jgi:hypothetical protein